MTASLRSKSQKPNSKSEKSKTDAASNGGIVPLEVEITRAQGDGAAPDDAVGGVRDADETLAALGLEQLDHRAEPSLTGTLVECHALDERCSAEGSRRLCHATTVAR